MTKTDKDQIYSIEFAHIYTDEKLNGNHFASADLRLEMAKIIHPNSTSVVLIDNYNAPEDGFDLKHYLQGLEAYGARPDFYVFEADLIPVAEKLLDAIEKPKIKRMYLSYIARKAKYPCSLLTAAWYLLRLGYLQDHGMIHVNNPRLKAEDLISDRIINIIPETFKGVEKEAHFLIGYSKFKEAKYKIEPLLFEEKGPVRAPTFVPETVN